MRYRVWLERDGGRVERTTVVRWDGPVDDLRRAVDEQEPGYELLVAEVLR